MEQYYQRVGGCAGFEDVVGEMAVGGEVYLARYDAWGKGRGAGSDAVARCAMITISL